MKYLPAPLFAYVLILLAPLQAQESTKKGKSPRKDSIINISDLTCPKSASLKKVKDQHRITQFCYRKTKDLPIQKHGPYIQWSLDGKKILEENYLAGEKHGHHRAWHLSGHRMWEAEYENGKLIGVIRKWDENGKFASTPANLAKEQPQKPGNSIFDRVKETYRRLRNKWNYWKKSSNKK